MRGKPASRKVKSSSPPRTSAQKNQQRPANLRPVWETSPLTPRIFILGRMATGRLPFYEAATLTAPSFMLLFPGPLSRLRLRDVRACGRRARAALRSWAEKAATQRKKIVRGVIALVLSPFLVIGVLALFTPLPPELREPAPPSLRILARDGRLLREVRADDGARARTTPLAEFPPHVRNAVLAAEDRHFYSHFGVDLTAVCRAALSNLWHRRIVSGASTITMQLARTVRPHPRTFVGKIREAALAVRIEASLSKDQILEQYLNRVVYGPNVRGFAGASHAYFNITPQSLSTAEAALIAGLPRGPSLYQVTKRSDLAKRRRDRILQRMADAGMIDEDTRERATAEKIAVALEKPSFGAPHLIRGLVSRTTSVLDAQPGLKEALSAASASNVSEIETTIDREIQSTAEVSIGSTLLGLHDQHVTAGAAIVIDNSSGDVLAWVGSPDFFNEEHLGQNDGVVALRQPGSSLKPFVYAEAMTHLGYTGGTVLPDVELHIPLPGGGDYVPHDYDTKHRGPIRLREALGNSLNIPAVYTIHELGTQRVLDRLHAFGFHSLTEPAEHYGPALALGDGEVTLVELANAYATLARGGLSRPVRVVSRVGDAPLGQGRETRVLDEKIAAMLSDILSDKTARTASFGDQNVLEFEFDVAAKTGTSKGYRDNIAVGYTRDVTVAVWVGNFDGSPMRNVSGITGAGPIFRSIMDSAAARWKRIATAITTPNIKGNARLSLDAQEAHRLGLGRTTLCSLSGEIPTTACPHRIQDWLPEGYADHAPTCSVHERVKIDRRNGLRAGPDCPASVTEDRDLERWTAPYTEWAARTSRPLAPEASSPECPIDQDTASTPSTAPHVAYPFDGSRFVLDPERPASLQMLDIKIEPDAPAIEVLIDGKSLGANKRAWPLAVGDHTITISSPSSGAKEAARVRFSVH